MNESTHMREYHGAAQDRVMAIVAVIHGGQIVVDCNTLTGINTRLSDLATEVPESPNYELFADRALPTLRENGTVL